MAEISIPAGLQTRKCIIGNGVIAKVPQLLREIWPGDPRRIRLVADVNTWEIAGEELNDLLTAAGFSVDTPYIFPYKSGFHAEYRYIEQLREPLKNHRPIAIGSGTINDLCKRTVFEDEIDGYLSFATAASVDGYTSYGAAITKDNFKQTLACPAPLAIVADSQIIRTAPFDMAAAGYADLAAKIPAGGDWIIADGVGATPIEPTAWGMVQTHLREWLANPETLKAGDSDAYNNLFNGLCQSGFTMQYMKDSRPVSGAEHLYSHCWEMRDIRKDGVQPSHGFKVAVGSLISTALMEEVFFNCSTTELRKLSAAHPVLTKETRLAQIDEFLGGTAFEANAKKVSIEKLLLGDALKQRQERLFAIHDELADKLQKQLMPFEELKRRDLVLGCPTSFEDIGLTVDALRPTTYAAGMIRNRYTILDVLTDLGIADEICARAAKRFAKHA